MKNTILPVQPSLILRTDNYQRLDSDLDGISHFYRYCVKEMEKERISCRSGWKYRSSF